MLDVVSLVPFVYQLSLVIALGAASVLIPRENFNPRIRSVLHGLLFGLVTVLGMLDPVDPIPGVVFDGRSVLISLCGLFYGPLAVTIAGAMAVAYRIWVGGLGAPVGLVVILCSGLIGIVFRQYRCPATNSISVGRLLVFGLIVHGVMLLAMFILLYRLSLVEVLELVATIALPVLVLYPIATVLLGKVLSFQELQASLLREARQSEAHFQSFIEFAPI